MNVWTPPASVGSGWFADGFAASRAAFVGPGSLALRSPLEVCAELSCPRILSGPSTLAAASAAELTPKNPRRLRRSFSVSPAIFTTLPRISRALFALRPRYPTLKPNALQCSSPALACAIGTQWIVLSFRLFAVFVAVWRLLFRSGTQCKTPLRQCLAPSVEKKRSTIRIQLVVS